MDYKELIERYASNGGDEKKMWASVAVTGEAMEYIKDVDPEKYECLMRKLSEVLDGKHYSEEMARNDVSKLRYTDANGNKKVGAHWTVDEIEAASAGMSFPKGTTPWDKYVAFNYAYHRFGNHFTEEEILKITYALFFEDEKSVLIWDFYSKLFA